MKRIPILPTLVVGAAVAVMIGLGIWQLQRAEWKEGLIAGMEQAGTGAQVSVACAAGGPPQARAGRSRGGEVGYRYLLPCRGQGETLMLDLGWSKRPDALPQFAASRRFAGAFAPAAPGPPRTLVLDPAVAPLEPSALPSPADLPNNHLLYAIQWFFFAMAAAVIYALALRRRRAVADPPPKA